MPDLLKDEDVGLTGLLSDLDVGIANPVPVNTQLAQYPRLGPEATLPDFLNQPPMQTQPWMGGMVPSVFPQAMAPTDLLPAIRKVGGDVVSGEPGDTHPKIIEDYGLTTENIDQRGFVGPAGQFIDRRQAAQITGLPTEREPGNLHSTDLPAYKAADPEKLEEIERKFKYYMRLLPWDTDPIRANVGAARLEQERNESLKELGITPVALGERPHIGEPLTQQQQELLFGKGLLGKTVGAAQRNIQGLATSFVQPEAVAMLPGVAGQFAKASKLAFGRGAPTVGHTIGTAFIPGMAEQAVEQSAQAVGAAVTGDWDSAIEKGGEALTTGIMLAMPVYAARRQYADVARYKAETERPLHKIKDELEESIFQTEANDPAIIDLRAKLADVQQRLDLRQTWYDQVEEEGRKSGRPVTITDESRGEGRIAWRNKDGSISVNRDTLNKLLEIDAKGDPKLVGRVIESLVNQEAIHAAIPDKQAGNYWDSLTDAERAFEESLYPFDKGDSSVIKGQEALRRRMEEASGLTPLEHLIRTARGPLSAKALGAMERAFRATREVLATGGQDKKNLLKQLAILNRAQKRYEQAKGLYASGQQKAAAVYGDVRPLTREGKGEVSVEEGGPGVLTQAEGRVEQKPKEEVLLTPEQDAQARSIWEGATDQGRIRLRGDPTGLLWEQLDPSEKLNIAKKAGVVKEEAPPSAPTVGAPAAAPTPVSGEPPGVPVVPGGEPPIRPTTPEVEKGQAAIKTKEGIAKQLGVEYVGTLHGRDRYDIKSKDAKGMQNIQVWAPEGATLEQIKAKIADRMAQYEEPFAKRNPSDWVKMDETEFFKMIKGIPGGYGEKEMMKFASQVRAEDIPVLLAEKERLDKAMAKQLGGMRADSPAEEWRKYNLMQLKSQSLGEWAINSPYYSGESPAARRAKYRGPVEREQLGLGLGLPGAHVPPGEAKPLERAIREGETPKPLGAQDMQGIAANMAPNPKKKFEDFFSYLKANVGAGVGKSAAIDLWRDARHDFVLNAKGEELAKLVKKYDLAKKLGLRYDEQGNVVGVPDPAGREVFKLEPLVEGQKIKKKVRGRAAGETEYGREKKLVGSKEMRARVEGAILEEMMKDIAPKKDLARKAITLEDIDFHNNNTIEGAYRRINPDEARNPDIMVRILGDQAETRNEPKSNTKRLLVLHDPASGSVEVVSTYYDPTVKVGEQIIAARPTRAEPMEVGELQLFQRQPKARTRKVGKMVRDGWQMVTDPASVGIKERPNVKLSSAFMRRYTPIASILLSDPVKDFHQHFESVRDYLEAIGKQAEQIERPVRAGFAGEEGELAAGQVLSEREHELAYWREELRSEAERQEQQLPPTSGVVRGEGGGFIGESAQDARLREGLQSGEIARSYVEPLKASELQSTLDWLYDELGDFDSAADVWEAFHSLNERAKQDLLDQAKRTAMQRRTGKTPLTWRELMAAPPPQTWLRGQHRQVISALQKISERIYENSYDPEYGDHLITPDQAYNRAVNEIADNAINRADAGDFIQRTLAKYGEKPEKPSGIPGIARVGPEAKGVERDLIGGRRPPIPVQGGVTAGRRFARAPEPPATLPGEPYRAPAAEPRIGGITGLPEAVEKPAPAYVPGGGPSSELFKRPEGWGPIKRYTKRPVVKETQLPFELRAEGELAPSKKVEIISQERRIIEEPAAKRSVPKMLEEHKRREASIADAVTRGTVRREVRPMMVAALTSADLEATQAWRHIQDASYGEIKGKLTKAQKKAITERGRMLQDASIAVRATFPMRGEKEVEMARTRRQKALEFAFQHGIKPDTEEFRKIPSRKEFVALYPELTEAPKANKAALNKLNVLLDIGLQKARKWMADKDPVRRRIGKEWAENINRYRKWIKDANDNWNDPVLHKVDEVSQEELHNQLTKERASGMGIKERENYLPGETEAPMLHEGPFGWLNELTFGGLERKGTLYRLPKKFPNAFHAIAAGPYWMPKKFGMADVVANRIRRGNYVIARRQWESGVKALTDPRTKSPVMIDPISTPTEQPTVEPGTSDLMKDPDTGETVMHTEYGWGIPPKYRGEYVMIDPSSGKEVRTGYMAGRRPFVVHKGYEDLVTALHAQSAIRQSRLGRDALFATRAIKHNWVLFWDTFHPGRLTQYAMALVPGFRNLAEGSRWGGGLAAIGYRAQDMQRAADLGLVSQRSVDWAMGKVDIQTKPGRHMEITRKELLENILVPAGLSPRASADYIYHRHFSNLPVIGWYNRKLFEEFVPGLLAESAIRQFEAKHKANPAIPFRALAKDIARDVNVIYGHLEANSLIKNPTFRDFLQIFLLAPMWREGLVQKEVRTLARVPALMEHGVRTALNRIGMAVDPARNLSQKATGRQGLPPMGALGEMMFKGMAGYFAFAQILNLMFRGKFTWQNQEEGRKLDAWLPIGDQGMWLPTLGVFGEILGDVIRLGETKGSNWQIALQMGVNALGPAGRAANVLFSGQDPATGQRLTTDIGMAKAMAGQAFPAPISLGTTMRAGAHQLFPGLVAPNEPGAWAQRAIGSMGMRVVKGQSSDVLIHRLAREWSKKEGLPQPQAEFSANEEESMSKLRHAIRIKDFAEAKRQYAALISNYEKLPKKNSYGQIIDPETRLERAMKLWSSRPFTGSKQKEDWFRSSLRPAEQLMYDKAVWERQDEYNKFLEFVMSQPLR